MRKSVKNKEQVEQTREDTKRKQKYWRTFALQVTLRKLSYVTLRYITLHYVKC